MALGKNCLLYFLAETGERETSFSFLFYFYVSLLLLLPLFLFRHTFSSLKLSRSLSHTSSSVFAPTAASGDWIVSPPPPDDAAEDDDQNPLSLVAMQPSELLNAPSLALALLPFLFHFFRSPPHDTTTRNGKRARRST